MYSVYSLLAAATILGGALLSSPLRSENAIAEPSRRLIGGLAAENQGTEISEPRAQLAGMLRMRLVLIRAITTSSDVAPPDQLPVFSLAQNLDALLSDSPALTYESPFWLEALPVTTQAFDIKTRDDAGGAAAGEARHRPAGSDVSAKRWHSASSQGPAH